ncbi:MAG: hypothetical protein H6703_16745 [Myxococcales bacterium]|nr:hypothetical protein [Myxococcales bacterium]MCB9550664.1 hypothetical protein [Myxococcales bacterium]
MQTKTTMFLAAALLAAFATGCVGGGGGGDGGGGSGGSGGGGGGDMGAPSGPANEVDARVEGGSAAGDVDGQSEQSVEGQYHAVVNEGRLDVFLASERGVIYFTVDTGTAPIPGSYPAGRALDGAGHLTFTTPMGIFESDGGSIRVSGCPNEAGARVTGRFEGVSLVNVMTDGADGTLDGEFTATIVLTDGSAQCMDDGGMGGMGGGGGGGISPGPQCANDTCDGPCCPFIPPFQECALGCFQNSCMDPFNPQPCITCLDECYRPMREDPNCGPRIEALDRCSQENECDASLEDNPCVAANCCDEYRGAF